MTSDQIGKMTLEQLNEFCATEVMKWRKTDYRDSGLPFPKYFYWVYAKDIPTGYNYDFSPATRIEEAWVLFREMSEHTYENGFSRRNRFVDALMELCEIFDYEPANWILDITSEKICRAALKAVMKEAK